MDVMRFLGRGDWVAASVVTVVESYTKGPDGAAAGCYGCYPQCFITSKLELRNNVGVKMINSQKTFLQGVNINNSKQNVYLLVLLSFCGHCVTE